jgi:predicted exporter
MKKFSVIFVLVALMMTTWISTASAQDSAAWAAAGTLRLMSSTTTTTAALAVPVGIVLTIIYVVSDDDEANLHQYMDNNAVALQHDLYIGGGESAQDLAVFFGVQEEQMADFGEILYENRAELAGLASPGGVEDGSAYEFAKIIITEMQARGWSFVA